MKFTWLDGGDYTISGLHPPVGAIHIHSPDGSTWSGLPVLNAPLHKEPHRSVTFLWNREDQTIANEVTYLCHSRIFPITRTQTLRDRQGRRLATWFDLRRRAGTLRDNMPEEMKPIILAMVLSSLYGFNSD
jgi:hypothetical protein